MSSSDLKARVMAAARREAPPTRPAARQATLLVVIAAVLLDLAIFFYWMDGVHLGDPKHHVADRPIAFVCGTVIGWAAIAAATTWVAFTRGGSMLGRRRAWMLVVALVTPLALFGWMLFWNSQYPETRVFVPERIGLKCLSFTLLMAAWPLVAISYVRRERNPQAPSATGAARGVGFGALAGVLVDLWCPITGPAHVLLGHITPIFILMALGALVGFVLNGVRAR